MLILRPIDAQHRFYSGDGGRLGGDRGGVRAKYGDGDFGVRDRGRTGDALGCGGIHGLAVMLADDEYFLHQIKPFFLRTSTSSPTSFTITPFWRCAGGSVFTVLSD